MNTFINLIGVVKEDVIKSLEIMGYGVLAIFIVITILIVIVQLMQYIEKKSKAKKALPDYVPFGDKCKAKFEGIKEKSKTKKKSDDNPDDNIPQ